MSWRTINEILGRATLDQEFCQQFLSEPVKTIERAGYSLTRQEKDILSTIQANDIYEFSGLLLKRFAQ